MTSNGHSRDEVWSRLPRISWSYCITAPTGCKLPPPDFSMRRSPFFNKRWFRSREAIARNVSFDSLTRKRPLSKSATRIQGRSSLPFGSLPQVPLIHAVNRSCQPTYVPASRAPPPTTPHHGILVGRIRRKIGDHVLTSPDRFLSQLSHRDGIFPREMEPNYPGCTCPPRSNSAPHLEPWPSGHPNRPPA